MEMSIVRKKIVVISGLGLLLTPLLSLAQTASPNLAEASLERAVARAVQDQFSSGISIPDAEPASENTAFPSDLLLLAQAQGSTQTQTQSPAGNSKAPDLGDLFPPDQAQGNAQDQARLDRRTHMLKMHQRYGLITLGAMAATIAVSGLAGGKNNTATGRDIHGALGSVTADMYFMAAYYAIRAPRIPGTPVRGPIRLHKALAWVHGPGMILTPILGAMALAQEQNGQKVHGIASAHSAVAAVTYTSFGLAILSVAIKF
jgi:hypothetical protein